MRVAGINVSVRRGSQLVSFLVPARFAAALIDHAREGQLSPSTDLRAEISRQLARCQAGRDQAVDDAGRRAVAFGTYQVLENAAPRFSCWSSTNAADVAKPRAAIAMQTLLQFDRPTDIPNAEQKSEVRHHLPPAFRLVPLQSEANFLAAAAQLKTKLDNDRTK